MPINTLFKPRPIDWMNTDSSDTDMGTQGLDAQAQNQNPTDLNNKMMALSANYPTPILDQYSDLLTKMPQPQDYQPNRFQRIMGALAGLGAGASPSGISGGQPVGFQYDPKAQMGVQDAIKNDKYNKAMSRYELQAQNLEKGANVEEKQISNKRQIATAEARAALTEEQNKIKQQQADTQRQKEHDQYTTAQDKLEESIRKTDETNQRLKDESARKEGDFQAQLKLKEEGQRLAEERAKLVDQYHKNEMAETIRNHNMENDKRKADIDAANEKIKILQQNADTAANKSGDKTVTTEEAKPPTTFQKIEGLFGYHPDTTTKSKTVTTTVKPNNKSTVPDNVKAALKDQPVGKHTLSDGSIWLKNPDGSIVKSQ